MVQNPHLSRQLELSVGQKSHCEYEKDVLIIV